MVRHDTKTFNLQIIGTVSTVAGSPTRGSTDGHISVALLSGPWGIVVDQKDGTIYFSEDSGNKIRKLSKGKINSLVMLKSS